MKTPTKSVKCKKCNFVFEVEDKPVFAWMDDYEDCLMPNNYCDKKLSTNDMPNGSIA